MQLFPGHGCCCALPIGTQRAMGNHNNTAHKAAVLNARMV
jgi:hypothetical protein